MSASFIEDGIRTSRQLQKKDIDLL